MKKLFLSIAIILAAFMSTSCIYIDGSDLWGETNYACWNNYSGDQIRITFDANTTIRKDVSVDFKNSSGISMDSLVYRRETGFNEIILYLTRPLSRNEKVKITWNDACYTIYLRGTR